MVTLREAHQQVLAGQAPPAAHELSEVREEMHELRQAQSTAVDQIKALQDDLAKSKAEASHCIAEAADAFSKELSAKRHTGTRGGKWTDNKRLRAEAHAKRQAAAPAAGFG